MTAQPKPMISIIVPVYKVEKFLRPCVDSILAQTFRDFELILVDDGSPDGCPALCDAYAVQDSRVRVIHQKNGGLSCARNTGIDAAQGAYLAFVDSDDWVHPEYLSQMYQAITSQQADLVICSVEDRTLEGPSFVPPHLSQPAQAGCFSGSQLLGAMLQPGGTYYRVSWNKLYDARLWQTLRFPVGQIGEDDATAPYYLMASKRVVCLDTPLYYYRLSPESICRSDAQPRNFDWVSAKLEWLEFFTQHQPQLADQTLALAVQQFLQLIAQFHSQPNRWDLTIKRTAMQWRLHRLKSQILHCTTLSWRTRLSALRWIYHPFPIPKAQHPRAGLVLPGDFQPTQLGQTSASRGGEYTALCSAIFKTAQAQSCQELVVFAPDTAAFAKLASQQKQILILPCAASHRKQMKQISRLGVSNLATPAHPDTAQRLLAELQS